MWILAGLATLFWLLQFVGQYFWLTNQNAETAQVRSFGLTGATLIGLSLFTSSLFKWVPRWAKNWRTRRHLGVAGTIFIVLHVGSALRFYFDFDLRAAYYSLHPLENPIVFGAIAYPIFVVMALTSTDWAVRKLGARWKFIHRFAYLAYWGAIFHFLQMSPTLYDSLPGVLLLVITGAAVFGQLYWYVRTVRQRGWKKFGSWVGAGLIVLTVVTAYLVYR